MDGVRVQEMWRTLSRPAITRLYHDALAREADARPAFLREACAGDEALRRDVESLLAQPSAAARFLDAPAIALAALHVTNPRLNH